MKTDFENIYFLGIGGIGMSALARYFAHEGVAVAGYDRTPSPLTAELEKEGIEISYKDETDSVPELYRDPKTTLIVYTPAIPADNSVKKWMEHKGFTMVKRSEMLGYISGGKKVMAVAGTHGKTSTTTLLSWLDHIAGHHGSAFLGGISVNFGSNLVLGPGETLSVEADEFDRSFLRLVPDTAVITSADADHLDIYGTHENLREAFSQFISQIKHGGTLIIKHGIELEIRNPDIKVYRYGIDETSDFRATGLRREAGGYYTYDIVCPDRTIHQCKLGIPGLVNIENSVAAVAALWTVGFDEAELKNALASFRGVKRRFEFYINDPELIYMDDYAHHPEELSAAIGSLREMFPGRSVTAIFQPHLYTRTRDFHDGFARSLSMADRVILLPIYPAREEPIEGVTSELIASGITVPYKIVQKEDLPGRVSAEQFDILVTFGAGDIDRYPEKIAKLLREKK